MIYMKSLILLFILSFNVSAIELGDEPTDTSLNPFYAYQVKIPTKTPISELKEEIVNTKTKLQDSPYFEMLRATKQTFSRGKTRIQFTYGKIEKAMTIVLKSKKKFIVKNYGITKSLLKKLQVVYPELTRKELKIKIKQDLIELE
jgi:hypothetical protein